MTLVIEARSQSVWRVGRGDVFQSRRPTPCSASTPRESPTITYAPGKARPATAALRTRETESWISRASARRACGVTAGLVFSCARADAAPQSKSIAHATCVVEVATVRFID